MHDALDRLGRILGVRRPAASAAARAAALDRRQLLLVAAIWVVALPLVLMAAIDQPVARAFSTSWPALIAAMDWITQWGESQWYLVPTAAAMVALFAAAPRAHGARRAVLRWLAQANLFVFANVALSGIAVNVIKVIIGRERPNLFLADGEFGAEPLSIGYNYASFPSGHTATAFSLAFALGAIARPALPWLLGFAGLIALSRVAVTAHFVGDTVAGAGVALITMLLLRHWFAGHGLVFTIAQDGRTITSRAGRLVGAAFIHPSPISTSATWR
jgi:undecaprenyl-diphosphatase